MGECYLSLDLGTSLGWCCYQDGEKISGTRLLPSGLGQRVHALHKFLDDNFQNIDCLIYEDVKRHIGTRSAHVYGSLLGKVHEWAYLRSVALKGAPVGQIKKDWTGKGNAKKHEMVAEAVRRGWVQTKKSTDDEADARAIMHWFLKNHLHISS